MEPQSKLGLIQQLGLSGVCAQWGNGLPVQKEEYQLAAKYAKLLAAIVTGEMKVRGIPVGSKSANCKVPVVIVTTYLLSLAQLSCCHWHNLLAVIVTTSLAGIGTTSLLSLAVAVRCQIMAQHDQSVVKGGSGGCRGAG